MASKKAKEETEAQKKPSTRKRLVRDRDVLMILATNTTPSAAVNAIVKLDPRSQILKRLSETLTTEEHRSILKQAMGQMGYRLTGGIVRVGKRGTVALDLGAYFKPGTPLVVDVSGNVVTLRA